MRPPICNKTAPPHLENPGSATAVLSHRPSNVTLYLARLLTLQSWPNDTVTTVSKSPTTREISAISKIVWSLLFKVCSSIVLCTKSLWFQWMNWKHGPLWQLQFKWTSRLSVLHIYIHLHSTKAVYSDVANVHFIVLEIFVLIGAESAKACAYLLDLAPLSDRAGTVGSVARFKEVQIWLMKHCNKNFKIEFLQTWNSCCSPV